VFNVGFKIKSVIKKTPRNLVEADDAISQLPILNFVKPGLIPRPLMCNRTFFANLRLRPISDKFTRIISIAFPTRFFRPINRDETAVYTNIVGKLRDSHTS